MSYVSEPTPPKPKMIGTPYVPTNPFIAALGVVAIAVAALGIALIFVGISLNDDDLLGDGTAGVVHITAGSGLISFGALSALLWLTAHAIRWHPPAD
jgi:hypothetical protein